jgi:hypothetical protein
LDEIRSLDVLEISICVGEIGLERGWSCLYPVHPPDSLPWDYSIYLLSSHTYVYSTILTDYYLPTFPSCAYIIYLTYVVDPVFRIIGVIITLLSSFPPYQRIQVPTFFLDNHRITCFNLSVRGDRCRWNSNLNVYIGFS